MVPLMETVAYIAPVKSLVLPWMSNEHCNTKWREAYLPRTTLLHPFCTVFQTVDEKVTLSYKAWNLYLNNRYSRFIKSCTTSWFWRRTASFLTCSELLSLLIRQVTIVKKLLPFCSSRWSPGSFTLHCNQLMLCMVTILCNYTVHEGTVALSAANQVAFVQFCKAVVNTMNHSKCFLLKKEHFTCQNQD